MVLRQNGKKLIRKRLLVSRSCVSFTRVASRTKPFGSRAGLADGTAGGGAAAPVGQQCLVEVWDQSWAVTCVSCPRDHPWGPGQWQCWASFIQEPQSMCKTHVVACNTLLSWHCTGAYWKFSVKQIVMTICPSCWGSSCGSALLMKAMIFKLSIWTSPLEE